MANFDIGTATGLSNDSIAQSIVKADSYPEYDELNNRISNIEDSEGGGTEVIEDIYTQEFNGVTDSGGGQFYYANAGDLIRDDGYLTEIEFIANEGDAITISICDVVIISNKNREMTITNEVFSGIAEVSGYQSVNVESPILIEKDQALAINVSGGVWYKADATLTTYQVGSTGNNSFYVAFGFVIASGQSVSGGEGDPLDADNRVKLNPCVLFNSYLTDGAEFSSSGWDFSGDGASPTANGSDNKLHYNKIYHAEDLLVELEVVPPVDGVFALNASYPNGGGDWIVDLSSMSARVVNTNGVVVDDFSIPASVASGSSLKVSVERVGGWETTFKIVNSDTGEEVESIYGDVIDSLVKQPRIMDTFSIYQESGSEFVTVKNFRLSSKKSPFIMLMGDSITEGWYLSSDEYDSRYGVKLKEALSGNVLISSRGGSKVQDVISTLSTEAEFIKPEFIMITIGTNNGMTEEQCNSILDGIEAAGAKPIMNLIPNTGNGNHLTVNPVIESVCKSRGALIGARFDFATSEGGDVTQFGLASDFRTVDDTHPNALGNEAMFDRIVIDCPYLFI